MIPEQEFANNHYEIDIARLDTAFIAATEAGAGVNVTVGGRTKLKIMAFNQRGISYIKSAHRRAYIYIVLAFIAGLWSLAWIGMQVLDLTNCGNWIFDEHNDYHYNITDELY